MSKILVAEILKPQGIRGELKLKASGNNAEQLLLFSSVFLDTEKKPRAIKGMRIAAGYAYIFLEGVITRNDAELLRGKGLYVEQSQVPPLASDTYYIDSLIGSQIRDQQGNAIGVLQEVLQHGAADVFVVKQPEGESAMFPFLKDVVTDVDTSAKLITVDSARLEQVIVRQSK